MLVAQYVPSMIGLQGSSAATAASDPASMTVAGSRAGSLKDLAGRSPLFLELCQDICGIILRVVETLLNESAGLLFQRLHVEFGAAGLAEQVAVQEGDRHLAAAVWLPHHVLAGEQFDGAVGSSLRRGGTSPAQASDQDSRRAAGRCQLHHAHPTHHAHFVNRPSSVSGRDRTTSSAWRKAIDPCQDQ